jgi:hypothetical protein
MLLITCNYDDEIKEVETCGTCVKGTRNYEECIKNFIPKNLEEETTMATKTLRRV